MPGDAVAEFVAALGRALEAAPKDSASLMLSYPTFKAPLGSLDPLLSIVKKKGRFAAEAEFDAAYLSSLSPPENDAKFWSDTAQRFKHAADGMKKTPAQQTLALELADSARKTAEAIRTAPAAAPASQ
jgi:hypothetical protein